MVCKVGKLSWEERLPECPRVLIDEVNDYLVRWDQKGYNVKVFQVEVDRVFYNVTGRIGYKVFVDNSGVFIIFSCTVDSNGTISEVNENQMSIYDIQTILEHAYSKSLPPILGS